MNQHMGSYRADIDGLRAIAVVSVILFHMGLPWIPGGFVGVDVFFVISGYLITRIITTEIDQNRFSILRFYERRTRRILPALFMMMAITTLLASAVMVPSTFRVFGASLVAAALSVSNAFFWFTGGYFAVASSSRPLLHTWSLGVEEQFYVIVPILLILVRRYTRLSWLAIILPIALASFLFAVFQVRFAPRAAFFLPFSRFWELMLGSLLAIGAVPLLARQRLNEVLGWSGLGLIMTANLFIDEASLFPGETALLPCLGAALVIHAGSAGSTSLVRLLSLRPIVFVGLISYSLYLWHWPLIVLLQSFVLQRDLHLHEMLALMVVIVLVSILSWRFVERPFRHIGQAPPAKVLAAALAGVALCAMVGVGLWLARGLPGRFSQPTLQYALAVEDKNPNREGCDSRPVQAIMAGDLCRIGAPGQAPSFAVVGDSFGDAMIPGIEAAALRAGKSGIVLTRAGCYPLFGIRQRDGAACRTAMDAVAAYLESKPEIGSVILVGRWTRIAEGTRFGAREMATSYIQDDQSKTRSLEENRQVFARAIQRIVTTLPDKQIFVTAFFPEQSVNVPQAAFMEAMLGRTPALGIDRSVYNQRQHYVRQVLTDAATRLGMQILDVGRYLCDQQRCRATEQGQSLYADDNHLTRSTAIRYSHIFDPVFSNKASD